MLSLPPPVSGNIIRPTLNEESSELTTDTSADFSLVNAVFQLAVLSRMIRTLGRSAGMFGLLRNRSVSSLTGSNTAKGLAQTASSPRASMNRFSACFMIDCSTDSSNRQARAGVAQHPDLDALVVGRLRAAQRIGHRRGDLPNVVERSHRLGERGKLRAHRRDAADRRHVDLGARG